jgi:hypothetical protein
LDASIHAPKNNIDIKNNNNIKNLALAIKQATQQLAELQVQHSNFLSRLEKYEKYDDRISQLESIVNKTNTSPTNNNNNTNTTYTTEHSNTQQSKPKSKTLSKVKDTAVSPNPDSMNIDSPILINMSESSSSSANSHNDSPSSIRQELNLYGAQFNTLQQTLAQLTTAVASQLNKDNSSA